MKKILAFIVLVFAATSAFNQTTRINILDVIQRFGLPYVDTLAAPMKIREIRVRPQDTAVYTYNGNPVGMRRWDRILWNHEVKTYIFDHADNIGVDAFEEIFPDWIMWRNPVAGTNVTFSNITDSTYTINASVAGGGTTELAENGLYKTGVNIRLGGSLLENTTIDGASLYKLLMANVRFQTDRGANITAANTITLGMDGNIFIVDGNTQINAITTTDWQAGAEVTLLFTGSPTIKHNTAGGAGSAVLLMGGSSDFVAAPDDVIQFVFDGTVWHETYRKNAAAGGRYTFSNGITESAGNNVKWGGTLTGATTITVGTHDLTFTSTRTGSSATLLGVNTSSGHGILGMANGAGYGVFGQGFRGVQGVATGSGLGGSFTSTSGSAIEGNSTTGRGIFLRQTGTANNTVTEAVAIHKFNNQGTGVGANGIGSSIAFGSVTTINASASSTGGHIEWLWADATDATRTGRFAFKLAYNGSTSNNVLQMEGIGRILFPQYHTLATYADDAAAGAAGLPQNTIYKTSAGQLMIKN